MVARRSIRGIVARVVLLAVFAVVLGGCAAATKVVRNEKVEIADYAELYFIPPEEDPRNVVPRVISEFEDMGFRVTVVDPEKPIEGVQGTGFLISGQGHVLTCAHVLAEEKEATVWVMGERYLADAVAVDEELDLAIIKLRNFERLTVRPVSLRSAGHYRMGEDVYAIGYPISNVLGDSARLTKGLISSTKGMKDKAEQMQVSAEVQPGNSGGPLFDQQGVVLGVVQGTLNPWRMMLQTGGALPQNVNFAVKSDSVLAFIQARAPEAYAALEFDRHSDFELMEKAVFKIRSGTIPEDMENKPKLVAQLEYKSIWDIWYRFRFFVVSFYDFDSQDILFRAGQGNDNMVSNEEVVIKDTFSHIRKTLNRE